MENRNFAVFILTHGRANNVITFKTLKDCGYTGRIIFVIDDEDDQLDEYIKRYGKENIYVFHKMKYIQTTDTIDNFKKHNAVVYARNAIFDIAKELNLTHFLVLDDDYDCFAYRFKEDEKLRQKNITSNIDKIFEAMLDFLDRTDALTITFGQNGDFIGGLNSSLYRKKLSRKAMNTFFCRTDRPFEFTGTINEDVNAYVTLGSKGKLFFCVGAVSIHQSDTQSNPGGLTDIYLDLGTYIKSFYSVITMPSAVKISIMGDGHYRIHHQINWNNCVPKIISDKFKK